MLISIKELLDEAGIKYKFNVTNHEFTIRNWNGTIWIASGDEPESLKGPNIGSAGIDEPFIQKKEVFDVVLSRVRHPKAKQREIFLTGTPEQLNWGHEVAQNDAGRYDLGVVVGRTADNVHLPVQFVKMLESAYDENQRAAYMNGLFVNLTVGRVYSYFERGGLGSGAKPEGEEVMAGIDFNVEHLTAEVFWVDGNRMHFFDEVELKNSTTYELADWLYERYPGIRVFPDPSGGARKTSGVKTDLRILQERGFRVEARARKPAVKDRVNAVQGLLREGRMTVDGCPRLVKDLEQVAWRCGDIDKVTRPELSHASDAAGYAVEKLFPVRVPEREFGGQPMHWRV